MDKDEILTGQSEEGSFSTKQAILFEFTSALRENSNSAWISNPLYGLQKVQSNTVRCAHIVWLYSKFSNLRLSKTL